MAHQHSLDNLRSNIQDTLVGLTNHHLEEHGPFEQALNFDLFPELDFGDAPTQFINYAALPLEHHDQPDYLLLDGVGSEHPKELPHELLSRWLECSLSFSLLGCSSAAITYGGMQYPACIISPLVASLVTVNAIDWVYKLCGQLPCQILPSEPEPAALSYKAVLPQASVYSALRILVSWPSKLASRQSDQFSLGSSLSIHEASLGLESLVLVECASTSIKTHLENTLQLIHVGLSGYSNSCGRQQDDIRDLEQKLDQGRTEVKNRTHRVETLKAAVRTEEILDRQRTSIQTFYESIGGQHSMQCNEVEAEYMDQPKAVVRRDLLTERSLLELATRKVQGFEKTLKDLKVRCNPWLSNCAARNVNQKMEDRSDSEPPLCTPVIGRPSETIPSTNPINYSFEQLWRARAGLHSVPSRHKHAVNVPTVSVVSSDNVPLSLDRSVSLIDGPCYNFRPSLLQARLERWVRRQELQQLLQDCGRNESATDAEDLLLLEAESDFLHSTRMDVNAYENLCQKHRLRFPGSTGKKILIADQDDVARPTGAITASDVTESTNSTRVASPERQTSEHGDLDDSGVPFDLLSNYCTMNDHAGYDTKETGGEPAMRLPRILAWSVTNTDAIVIESTLPTREPDFIIEESQPQNTVESIHDALLQGNVKEVWPKLDKHQKKHLMASLVRVVVSIWHNFDFLGGNNLEEFLDKHVAISSTDVDPVSLQEEKQIHECTQPSPSVEMPPAIGADVLEGGHSKPKKLAPAGRLCRLEDEFMNRSFLDAFKEATMPSRHNPTKGVGLETTDSRGHDRIGTEEIAPAIQGGNDRVRLGSNTQSLYYPSTWQRMTTTKARVQESINAHSKTHILPMLRVGRESSWMRQFDFSLDDLLIQVEPVVEPSTRGKNIAVPWNVQIVGVSRWKTYCPVKTEVEQCADWAPRSANEFQMLARPSSYPLVHLLSLPDVFCPKAFGGEDDLDSGEDRAPAQEYGLAHDFARLLAQHSPEAAEVLTMSAADKERVLYHRWMAAWHERSPHVPKTTGIRLDMAKASRRYRSEESRARLGLGLERIVQGRGGGKGDSPLLGSAPEDVRQRSLGQQPRDNGEEAGEMGEMAIQCTRCEEESREREQVSQELAWFEETVRFLDEVMEKDDDGLRHDREDEDELREHMMMGLSADEVGMARAWTQGQSMASSGQVSGMETWPWGLSEEERTLVQTKLMSRSGLSRK